MRLLTYYKALHQDCRIARDWPLSKSKVRAAHCAVQRETAPTRTRSSAFTLASWGTTKNECPKLQALEEGIHNINIDNCHKEHNNLFFADEGYGLVQKQEKGV